MLRKILYISFTFLFLLMLAPTLLFANSADMTTYQLEAESYLYSTFATPEVTVSQVDSTTDIEINLETSVYEPAR